MGDTLYAKCGDLSIAYQVFGEGPVDLVFVGPFVSHIELAWTQPEFKSFFDHRDGARAGTTEAQLTSIPTPGPRAAMRRSDRAVEVIARRTPWILRTVTRLNPPAGRSRTPTGVGARSL